MKKSRRALIIIPILLIFCGSLIAQETPKTQLTKISFQKSGLQPSVLIECTKPVSYEAFPLLSPNRLVLDLTKIESITASPLVEVNNSGILKIATSAQLPETARIVVYFMGNFLKYNIKEVDTGLVLTFLKQQTEETPVKVEVKPQIETKKPIQKVQEKAAVNPAPSPASSRVKDMSIGFNMGYFFFQDSAFQDLYSKSALFYRGEMSFTLPLVINNIDVWTAVTHFKKNGKTSLYAEDLSFSFTSFSIALRYLREISIFTPFVGGGIDYISYKETFPANFIVPSMGGSDLGFHFQGGVYVRVTPYLSGKLQIRYLTSKTTENNLDVNLGGVEYAFGLIFHFDL